MLPLAILLGVLVGLAAVPQQSREQPPGFRSGIQVVEIDARVTDRDGHFVRDLQFDEFEVYENGVRQQLRTVFLVGGSDQPTRSPNAASGSQLWIFVFDDRNLQPNGLRRARMAAEHFVEHRLKPGDFVAVIYQDRVVENRITNVRADALAALRQVRLASEGPDENPSNAFAARLLLERGIRNSLDVLESLSLKLTRIYGPKNIIFFSDGFSMTDVEATLWTVVTRITEAGARLYAIDTRGLAGAPPDSLNSLATDSGGFVVFNINNLKDALAEVEADVRHYYVVAYYPTNTAYDGKVREIEVRVKRPDVRVRARKRYMPVDPKDMLVPKR